MLWTYLINWFIISKEGKFLKYLFLRNNRVKNMKVSRIIRNERVYLDCYLPDKCENFRPETGNAAVLIFPGGGYNFCSPREAEPIALKFLSKGFTCFVLNYSVKGNCLFPASLLDAAWAMKKIRDNSVEFDIDPDKIAVTGFSAGGHLAASLSTMYNKDEVLNSELGVEVDEVRPNASVLCYPVISGVEDTHIWSFHNILEKDNPTDDELINLSCEYYINEKTPPAFIWHTANDSTVPVINSLVYAEGLASNKVPFELHIYDEGDHGLATCDRMTLDYETSYKDWVDKAADFLIKYLHFYD